MQKNRKPAPIVKCPYCTHKGSARGLFAHIRLAHPNEGYVKPPVSKKVTVSVHPYACSGDVPSFKSGGILSVSDLTKQEKKIFDKVFQDVLEKVCKDINPSTDTEKFAENFVCVRKAILETIESVRSAKGFPKGMNG